MKSAPRGSHILDHPADLGFEVWAPGISELFQEAALAFTGVLSDPEAIAAEEVAWVHLESEDLEGLMYLWLGELLYYFDGEHKLFRRFDVTVNVDEDSQRCAIDGEIRGESFSREKHVVRTYVKAVTFHQMSIRETETGYHACIYLDI